MRLARCVAWGLLLFSFSSGMGVATFADPPGNDVGPGEIPNEKLQAAEKAWHELHGQLSRSLLSSDGAFLKEKDTDLIWEIEHNVLEYFHDSDPRRYIFQILRMMESIASHPGEAHQHELQMLNTAIQNLEHLKTSRLSDQIAALLRIEQIIQMGVNSGQVATIDRIFEHRFKNGQNLEYARALNEISLSVALESVDPELAGFFWTRSGDRLRKLFDSGIPNFYIERFMVHALDLIPHFNRRPVFQSQNTVYWRALQVNSRQRDPLEIRAYQHLLTQAQQERGLLKKLLLRDALGELSNYYEGDIPSEKVKELLAVATRHESMAEASLGSLLQGGWIYTLSVPRRIGSGDFTPDEALFNELERVLSNPTQTRGTRELLNPARQLEADLLVELAKSISLKTATLNDFVVVSFLYRRAGKTAQSKATLLEGLKRLRSSERARLVLEAHLNGLEARESSSVKPLIEVLYQWIERVSDGAQREDILQLADLMIEAAEIVGANRGQEVNLLRKVYRSSFEYFNTYAETHLLSERHYESLGVLEAENQKTPLRMMDRMRVQPDWEALVVLKVLSGAGKNLFPDDTGKGNPWVGLRKNLKGSLRRYCEVNLTSESPPR